MRIILQTADGKPIEEGIASFFNRLQSNLQNNSGRSIAIGISDAIKNHFSNRFPGSDHYNPNKVVIAKTTNSIGSVDVNVPGVTRAYHDIDIKPRFSKSLTIPLHREAYGHKATDFNDLFMIKKNNGNAFLARNNGGSLQMMYLLSKGVHQRQDSSIMPSDETLATSAINNLLQNLDTQNKEI